MPFCPVCRAEYRPGFSECADCGSSLVAELPLSDAERRRVASASDVVVARVHGQMLAQMWAELLGNHGIASRVNPITGVVDTVYPTDTSYELLVSAPDAPRARSILPARPSTDRIRRREVPPTEDEILDEVDRAIAAGKLDLADELLSSLEDPTPGEDPRA